MDVLRIGDTVEWRGSWGRGFPALTKVTGIVVGGKHGDEVTAVPWAGAEGREVVVDLSNGHWAYGFQIAPPSGDAGVTPDYEAAS